MKLIALFAIGLMLFACGSKKNATNADVKETVTEIKTNLDRVKLKASIGQYKKDSDPITIDTLFVVGNTLYMDVTYGGGCENHEFELIGSEMIAKSMPPIRGMQLAHNAKGDKCRALVKKRLEIDITALAYVQQDGSEIYLTIDGWEHRIYYKYAGK